MDLGRIVNVRIDSALKDVFEEFGVAGLSVRQASEVDVEESGASSSAYSWTLVRRRLTYARCRTSRYGVDQ